MSRKIEQKNVQKNPEFHNAKEGIYKILITANGGRLYTFLLKEGRIYKAVKEDDTSHPIGSIVIGKVMNVMPQMNSCFVKLGKNPAGEDIMGFLPFNNKDVPYQPLNRKADGRVLSGDEILVSVAKEALKTKQCQLSLSVELPGHLAVLKKGNGCIKYSKKIDKKNIQRLSEGVQAWKMSLNDEMQEFMQKLDITIRTNAMSYDTEEVVQSLNDLLSQFFSIDQNSHSRTVFSVLYEPDKQYMQAIRNLPISMVEEVVTDDRFVYEALSQHPLMTGISFRLYSDDLLSLPKIYSLDTHIKELLSPKAYMKSGGYLIIEPTEALISIDVNTGKAVKKSEPEEYFFKINMEAVDEILYQLSARNLSGIIIIDFINMKTNKNQNNLLEYLKMEATKDPVTTQFVDYTKLGLAEMTRMKTSKPLKEVMKDWKFS